MVFVDFSHGLQQVNCTANVIADGRHRILKGNLNVTLGGQVIHLVRLNANDVHEPQAIVKIAIVSQKPLAMNSHVIVNVIDTAVWVKWTSFASQRGPHNPSQAKAGERTCRPDL